MKELVRGVDHDRRRIVALLAGAGAGAAVFGRALAALAAGTPKVTAEMVKEAEWISGVAFTDDERALMLEDLNETAEGIAALREFPLDNTVPPAVTFAPLPAPPAPPADTAPLPARRERPAARPGSDEELAFSTVRDLGRLLREKKVSSTELTKLYLARIAKYDPVLSCAVTVTSELALAQAKRADEELAAGKDRGPLHGIPWGAKDLIAVPGYRTTWGSVPFRDQTRPETATVYRKLEEAGAVLVAKTSVGELAWGDVWFGGTTKNPWKTDQGSSGSSAGSASATAAGLVGFAIGTETLGSIVSPCTRCGVTGLRPTFGRVSRHGVMALAWTMDKVGPIARSAEDCALVFSAIEGRDPLDPYSADGPPAWPPRRTLADLTIGFVEELFEEERGRNAKTEEEKARAAEWRQFDRRSLDLLRQLGARLVPVKLPSKTPVGPLSLILTAEAASAFDALVLDGRVKTMVRQTADAWPNVFRQGRLIPAVDYLRAQRVRSLLMRETEECLAGVDLFVAPTYGGRSLLLTNLTGHPCVVVPNGFRLSDGTPTSLTFTGRLRGEADVLAAADLFQRATDFHTRRPKLPEGDAPKG
ncbi:MAG: amidase [Thermoanaerobaculia bacterium]|nr:amidase [Thermoanaerobaculia bacterium]